MLTARMSIVALLLTMCVLIVFHASTLLSLKHHLQHEKSPDTREGKRMVVKKWEAKRRNAVVTFVDSGGQDMHGSMYGVYSIRQRLRETQMFDVDQLALIPLDFPKPEADLLVTWLGEQNVRRVNTKMVLPQKSSELWRGVFNKIVVFNVTEYARIILLDNDVLVRTNIQHWLEYPTPCATQDRGVIEWNSGAMTLTPSTFLFETLVRYIPRSRRWSDSATTDTLNSGHGQQGFLSAFFTSNLTNETMHTMPFQNAVISSALKQEKNKYFVRQRPTLIETVHFTTHKPWRPKSQSGDRKSVV